MPLCRSPGAWQCNAAWTCSKCGRERRGGAHRHDHGDPKSGGTTFGNHFANAHFYTFLYYNMICIDFHCFLYFLFCGGIEDHEILMKLSKVCDQWFWVVIYVGRCPRNRKHLGIMSCWTTFKMIQNDMTSWTSINIRPECVHELQMVYTANSVHDHTLLLFCNVLHIHWKSC